MTLSFSRPMDVPPWALNRLIMGGQKKREQTGGDEVRGERTGQ